MNSWIKLYAHESYSKEQLAHQFLVPFFKKKQSTFIVNHMWKTQTATKPSKASTGWLEKFKNRHGIRNLSTRGEKLSAAVETVEPFLQKLRKVIEEKSLTPEQIYNADET